MHATFFKRVLMRVDQALILRLQQGLKRVPLLGKPRFRKQDVDVIGGNRLACLDTPYVFVCPPENKKSSGTSSISPERAVRQLCHSCGRFRIRHYFSVDPADAREWSNCVSARLLYHTAPGLPTRFCTRRHLTFSPPLGYNTFYGTRPLLKQNTEV